MLRRSQNLLQIHLFHLLKAFFDRLIESASTDQLTPQQILNVDATFAASQLILRAVDTDLTYDKNIAWRTYKHIFNVLVKQKLFKDEIVFLSKRSQHRGIIRLAYNEPCTVQDITNQLGITPKQRVSRITTELKRMGTISERLSATDGKTKEYSLTEKGKKAYVLVRELEGEQKVEYLTVNHIRPREAISQTSGRIVPSFHQVPHQVSVSEQPRNTELTNVIQEALSDSCRASDS